MTRSPAAAARLAHEFTTIEDVRVADDDGSVRSHSAAAASDITMLVSAQRGFSK